LLASYIYVYIMVLVIKQYRPGGNRDKEGDPMATKIDTIIDGTGGSTKTTRKMALKAARQKLADGIIGAECRVQYDYVTYVVGRDGIYRNVSGPDGERLSSRRIR
jgi:hypothetical protein